MSCSPQSQQAYDNLSLPRGDVFGVKKLLRRVTSRRGSRGTSPSRFGVVKGRVWSKVPGDHPLDLNPAEVSFLVEELGRIEKVLADQLRRGPSDSSAGGAPAALHIDTIVCAMPCIELYPAAWPAMSEVLAGCPLFQHAKAISFPAAAMQYFLDTGALTPPSPATSSHLLSLTCDDMFVECSSCVLRATTSDQVELGEFNMSYMAEFTG